MTSETKRDIFGIQRVEVRLKNLEVSDLIRLSHISGKSQAQIINLILQLIQYAKAGSCLDTLSKISRLSAIFDIAV